VNVVVVVVVSAQEELVKFWQLTFALMFRKIEHLFISDKKCNSISHSLTIANVFLFQRELFNKIQPTVLTQHQ
jgi:hypothetical protein